METEEEGARARVRSELKRNAHARFDFKEEKPESRRRSATSLTIALMKHSASCSLPTRQESWSSATSSFPAEDARQGGIRLSAGLLHDGLGGRAYTFDRIIRGHQHIKAAFVGLVGATQPGRIAEYLDARRRPPRVMTD